MKIYNTLTHQKELFEPIEHNHVKMYVCGPTVYNYFHIGNARTFLFFDVVRRYFEFKGMQVTFVQNLTDVDDNLIAQSNKENCEVSEIAEKYIDAFFTDIEKLGLNRATHYPKATEFIDQMIALIADLKKKGFAYEASGDVYFSVNDFRDYGKLSRKNLEELKAGARVDQNLQKRHPADFTLWKKAKKGEPSWSSPWGNGRPGWHTECVVMSRKLLGETFDIHGGAVDLIFPHHENEIAQAGASGSPAFARFWMHGGFLNIEGEKMSKSLDNFFLTRDILKIYNAETIRFFFLSKHYRSTIEFNEELVKESDRAVKNLYGTLKEIDYLSLDKSDFTPTVETKDIRSRFTAAMDDDFNTAVAIALIFEVAKKIRQSFIEKDPAYKNFAHLMVELGQILGFFTDLEAHLSELIDQISEDLIQLLLKYRQMLKKEKNWKLADMIREDLRELGIEIKDTPEGTVWNTII